MNSHRLTAGEALVELLADYGVELVFGIPGTHSIELYRGLGTGRIRHISPRHEQGGGFMADGYARISGKPGVCFVITGPGVTNIATPMGEAYMDSVPMLVISPVNEPDPHHYNQGRLHEITNQAAVTAPLTRFTVTIRHPDEIPDVVARAFSLFSSQRPGPVHINIPLSVLPMRVERRWRAIEPPAPPLATDSQIESAAQQIQRSDRPVLVVGGGTSRCADRVIALAETIPCPILTTVAARGVVRPGHPLSVGAQLRAPYVQTLLQESDLALFAGTEFAQTDHWNDKMTLPEKQVWINLDDQTLDHAGDVLAIHGEAGDAASRITRLLAPADKQIREQVNARCSSARSTHDTEMTDKEKRHWRVLGEIMKGLPPSTRITSDMTQIAYTAVDYLPMEQPNSWLHPTGYGTLGYALPAAIGALLAEESGQALVIVGDAGLQYTMQEMALAREQELNLVILLWDNNALQQICDDMDNAGIDRVGVCQLNPDFIALALAIGWHARNIESLETLAGEIEKAFRQSGPVLLRFDEKLSSPVQN